MTPVIGCIGVSRSASKAGWVIQFGTRSRWNHAAILEDITPEGLHQVLEADGDGFRRATHPPGKFSWDPLDLPTHQRAAIVAAAQECLGLPYDWSDIWSFVWRFNRVRLTNRPYADHPDTKVICSEAAAWAFRRGTGLDPWPGVAAGEISPGDIEEALWHPKPHLGLHFRRWW